MDERRSSRLKVWTPLLFSLVMIFGMVLGFNLRDTLRNKRDIQTVIDRNDRLEQIIDLINEKYVDSVNTNLLFTEAISGILSHLDPHTVYIPADELQAVNEDLGGSFFGIGVEFSIIRDTIQVTSVVPGGPAEKAGIETGDQLLKVEDSTVAGVKITSERIIKMLRGKEHSKVGITLFSQIRDTVKKAIIERGAIPIYSVEAHIMLDSITGYIKINRFSATTYDEFREALKQLKTKGVKSLILDLRQNPGGYLDAATDIADEFLDDEKLIVYTQGRRSPRIEYKSGEKGLFEKGKLAVLVDENSASASEILAGAVQDWDRGIIVGRRTYGKGLVQEQYDLDDGSALRLTIAKYYTPSGRSIQRSYAKGKEAYAADISTRFKSGELTGTDTVLQADTSRYFTSRKRLVYSGGGITPDINVPYDTAKFNTALLNFIFSDEMKNLLWDYFIRHRGTLSKYPNVASFNAGYSTSELVNTLLASSPPGMQRQFRDIMGKPGTSAYLQLQLKAQLARFLFRNDGYYSVFAPGDRVVQEAWQALNSRRYLAVIRR